MVYVDFLRGEHSALCQIIEGVCYAQKSQELSIRTDLSPIPQETQDVF